MLMIRQHWPIWIVLEPQCFLCYKSCIGCREASKILQSDTTPTSLSWIKLFLNSYTTLITQCNLRNIVQLAQLQGWDSDLTCTTQFARRDQTYLTAPCIQLGKASFAIFGTFFYKRWISARGVTLRSELIKLDKNQCAGWAITWWWLFTSICKANIIPDILMTMKISNFCTNALWPHCVYKQSEHSVSMWIKLLNKI